MQRQDHINDSHFDVRAPLATFDTIDLGDGDFGKASEYRCVPSVSLPKTDEEEANVSDSAPSSETGSVIEAGTPTGSTANVIFSEDIVSENQDSVGQYETISNSCDDDSCHEGTEAEADDCDSDSDSDSSDSEGGYIKSGYISVNKGVVTTVKTPSAIVIEPQDRQENHLGSLTPNRTPTSSPRLGYSGAPKTLGPLPKFSSRSKQKAYEKRLKRLQVTTSPVARPRSTTPISIHTLEEYINISSPEQSPSATRDKLKITLPYDEFKTRSKSPRKSSKYGQKDVTPNEFDFSEEILFSHTKSALLVEDISDTKKSPKKVLISPTISTGISTHELQSGNAGSPPVLVLHQAEVRTTNKTDLPPPKPTAKNTSVGQNWIAFDEDAKSNSLKDVKTKPADNTAEADQSVGPPAGDIKKEKPDIVCSVPIIVNLCGQNEGDILCCNDVLNDMEEILTVEKEGDRICDIKVESCPTNVLSELNAISQVRLHSSTEGNIHIPTDESNRETLL